jgi:hypothetical protein
MAGQWRRGGKRTDNLMNAQQSAHFRAVATGEHPLAAKLLDPALRTALIIGHPAHEVRVYEWMRLSKPSVYVLTSGSRSGDDRSRLEASRVVINETGAAFVTGWGGIKDRAIYGQILAAQHTDILQMTRNLSHGLIAQEVELVVADSWQFYNVVHDLTHLIARCAVKLAERELGREIAFADYPVLPKQLAEHAPVSEDVLTLSLSEQQGAYKRSLAERIPHIAVDVAELVRTEGEHAFFQERYALPPSIDQLIARPDFKPEYELYGEARVRTGIYTEVLRWSHFSPIIDALTALL